jgi:tetratricopeptide (TPR) repeat protein
MIRHQVYFDTLGSMKEDSASWRSVFAGLSVLRLVDSYVDAASGAPAVNWAQLHSVRTALENVAEGDPVRAVLNNLVEELASRTKVDDSVCAALLAYGRTLDAEANWGLATDVFGSVAKLTRPEKNARLAVDANVAMGGAARRGGDWETSARAYSQAAYIADTMGDRQGVLTVQVGIANTYLAKGNLPQAQSILDDVVLQARDQHFPAVEADALHSRAALAERKGLPHEALALAHLALPLMGDTAARDVLLQDIGAIFMELGMNDAARDAHLVVVATGRTKFVRWLALINLLELASIDNMRVVFDNYARELTAAPLSPWLRANFLVSHGQGLERFGSIDMAEEVLQESISYAEAHQFHQVAFTAQDALSKVRCAARDAVRRAAPTWVPEEVADVARAISALRESTKSPA